MPEHLRTDGNNIWPCQCYYTKMVAGPSMIKDSSKRKEDHQQALARKQKKGKAPVSPIK